MNKKIVFLFIVIFNCLLLNAQKIKYDYIIDIKIEFGDYHSLRYIHGGLILKSLDTVEFIKSKDLFYLDKIALQNFLHTNSLILKDSIIDNMKDNYCYMNYPPLKIEIMDNDRVVSIYWIAGKSKYLEECIRLLNAVIPDEKKDIYEIIYIPY